MNKGEALYLASMCSMIQELMRHRRTLDKRIDELFDELCNEAWFAEYIQEHEDAGYTVLRLIKNDSPDDYQMD